MQSVLNLVKGMLALSMVLLSQGCVSISSDYNPAYGRIGIIVLHGKANYPSGHNSPLVRALRSQGFKVLEPSMPWSGGRGIARYTASLHAAFDIIEKDMHRLRNEGAGDVFLIGHSMGAMAAFSFAAHRGGISGVIGIAPGHTVGGSFHLQTVGQSVDKARNLVTAGKGNETTWFEDYNGPLRTIVRTTPEIYLSYFDPNGESNIPVSLSKLKETPALWVAPSQDPVTTQGFANMAFANASSNKASRFVMITSGHADAPSKSSKEVTDWINTIVGKK